MAKRFGEQYKIDIWGDPYGSTVEQFTPYFDMLGFDGIDFIVNAGVLAATQASTGVGVITCRLLQATGATGGGATAISSATAVMTKGGTVVSTGSHGKSLLLRFTTLTAAATVTVLGQEFIASTNGSAAYYFAGLASNAATVASEGFKTAFNATNNTLSSAWVATTHASGPYVFIRPKTVTSVPSSYYVSAAGSTLINVGIPELGGHIGIDSQYLKDGCRYVSLGAKSSVVATPITVTVIRKKADGPAANTNEQIAVSKYITTTSV